MSFNAQNKPAADLMLPKTMLCVGPEEMWRENENGTVLMRVPINDITEVRFSRPFNPGVLVFLGIAAGLAAIGYYVSNTDWLSVVVYVLAVIVGGFGLMGARSDRLTVERRSGDRLIFDCDELADEVDQFTQSFRDYLNNARGG